MKDFVITENYFEITKNNKQLLRLDYSEIKSVKILYYHTFLQKIINLLPNINKKNYKLSIHQNNEAHFTYHLSQIEKELLKPKLDRIRTNIENIKKTNRDLNVEESKMLIA
jgi:hypothetical protein